jgi:uncharacterized protein YegL
MTDNRGQLLPMYVVVDESTSMSNCMGELNAGLKSLHDTLLVESMTAAKVRIAILGFSDDVQERLALSDLRYVPQLPQLYNRGGTSYGAAFADLARRIPADVGSLKAQGYTVYRPTVVFLSDGQPTDQSWEAQRHLLLDRATNPAAPNIIACGIGQARPETILAVATRPEFAFVAVHGAQVGPAVAEFCTTLTTSIIKSVSAAARGMGSLSFDKPRGFELAMDVV